MDTGKSALGLDGNVAAALGYPIGIIAIICLVMEKENRFVKFHALQSLLLHAAYIILALVMVFIFLILTFVGIAASAATNSGAGVGLMGMLSMLIWFALIVAYLVVLVMSAVKAYGGTMFKLPVIGNLAEKWTK
jgi:uncharacterized membrane protein